MHNERPRSRRWILPLVALVFAVAATRVADFPTGTFSASDPDGNVIDLRFDTAGAVHVVVNGDDFSLARYTAREDDFEIVEETAPPDYTCAAAKGKYKWKLDDKTLRFTLVDDSCELRVRYLTGLPWLRKEQAGSALRTR